MRKLLSGILILTLAGALAAQTSEWKRYKNTNGNFTVLFPGEPTDTVNKTEDDSMQSHTLLAREATALYTVVYTTMSSEQKVDDATYQAFKAGVFKELPKCEAGAEQPASPVLEGYIGHAYRLNCDMPNTRVTIIGNLYWGKHYAFAVMTMFPANVAEPTAAENKFTESFAVIDAAR